MLLRSQFGHVFVTRYHVVSHEVGSYHMLFMWRSVTSLMIFSIGPVIRPVGQNVDYIDTWAKIRSVIGQSLL